MVKRKQKEEKKYVQQQLKLPLIQRPTTRDTSQAQRVAKNGRSLYQYLKEKHPDSVRNRTVLYPVEDRIIIKFNPFSDVKELYTSDQKLGGNFTKLIQVTDFVYRFRALLQIDKVQVEQLEQDLLGKNDGKTVEAVMKAFLYLIIQHLDQIEGQLNEKCIFINLIKNLKNIKNEKLLKYALYRVLLETFQIDTFDQLKEDNDLMASFQLDYIDDFKITFYNVCTYEDRLDILCFLKECLIDSRFVRDDIYQRLETLMQTKKEKTTVEQQIKQLKRQSKFRASDSKRQIADKKMQLQSLEKIIKKSQFRTQSLGQDRNHHFYYIFPYQQGKLYKHDPETNSWAIFTGEAEVKKILSTLIQKGIREQKLYNNIKQNLDKIKKHTYEESTSSDSLTTTEKGDDLIDIEFVK